MLVRFNVAVDLFLVIHLAWNAIRDSLGELPLMASEEKQLEKLQDADDQREQTQSSSARRILPDGTYASESAFVGSTAKSAVEAIRKSTKPPIRGKVRLVLILDDI